jgi:hypothetical protein
VIWLLFRRACGQPRHLLAQGFDRASGPGGANGLTMSMAPGLPGVVCLYPNEHVETMMNSMWCRILQQLGKGGDLVMVNLLLDGAVFVPVGHGGGLIQISGMLAWEIDDLGLERRRK